MMLFNYKKNSNTEFEITVNQTVLTSVSNTKFLGVVLDDKLSWKEHVVKLKTKLKKKFWIVMLRKNYIKLSWLKNMLYYVQFYSHLSYCIVLWGSMLSNEHLQKLRVLQNNCVRLLDKSNGVEEIFKKQKILKLDQLTDLEQKKLRYKLNHNLLPPPT